MGITAKSSRSQYLNALGITQWVRRTAVDDINETKDKGASVSPSAGLNPERWRVLQARVKQCINCDLHQARTQTVFGVGNPQANWLIIGEAPGAEEDRQGEPFVGPAGKLLDNMLGALGLLRSDVYIANILKCRPPNNRDPRPEEVKSCAAYLQQQVDIIKPSIILAVGRIAAQNLLNSTENIGRLRGKQFEYENTGIPIIVTYHPAYLLRSPKEKRKSWQDLLFAKSVLANSTSLK